MFPKAVDMVYQQPSGTHMPLELLLVTRLTSMLRVGLYASPQTMGATSSISPGRYIAVLHHASWEGPAYRCRSRLELGCLSRVMLG
jgi:hypothetical protein